MSISTFPHYKSTETLICHSNQSSALWDHWDKYTLSLKDMSGVGAGGWGVNILIITNHWCSSAASVIWAMSWDLVGWLCWGLTSQSTIFQSYRDGAIASWVINQYFRGVKCLAQGHNTAAVGLEPRTSRSRVRHSTTEPSRSPPPPPHVMRKPAKWLCVQRRLRSAWASAQFDQSLRCPHEESLGP